MEVGEGPEHPTVGVGRGGDGQEHTNASDGGESFPFFSAPITLEMS